MIRLNIPKILVEVPVPGPRAPGPGPRAPGPRPRALLRVSKCEQVLNLTPLFGSSGDRKYKAQHRLVEHSNLNRKQKLDPEARAPGFGPGGPEPGAEESGHSLPHFRDEASYPLDWGGEGRGAGPGARGPSRGPGPGARKSKMR